MIFTYYVFYLRNELERNYRVINDLQMKLISLNRSIATNDNNLQFGGSIDRLPSHLGLNRSIRNFFYHIIIYIQ